MMERIRRDEDKSPPFSFHFHFEAPTELSDIILTRYYSKQQQIINTMATTDKYDRQLRLWGASGQRALGNTMVVLLGSSACGTETLKNLVLPGVGSFLVVDDGDEASSSEAAAAAQGVQKCPELDS